jgi:photosystem II stability/assembly factor-like uncharacterized protein
MTHQLDPAAGNALKFRCIGPPRGGRVVAVAGHPTERNTFYFGACAGGVWKTVDGGLYWENISDGYFGSSAVGAMAVSAADPNVIYAGTGESTIRGDVSWGDGVYKSTDGGKTWTNVGLRDTHHIGKIQIHPKNPDLVYVAALGHAFGPNAERGVFRTLDGGQNWEKVLHVSERAGAVDLALDPTNPRVLYATIWQVHRHFWELVSGGPGSGLWKSVDAGDSWTDISRARGLPQEGILGKIGVAVSPAKADRVWAIVETEGDKSGVYRSDNGGERWEFLTGNRDLLARPWYYMHIFADPQDADTVYVTNLKMWKSVDGGNNYAEITTPHGDNHDLWIDPIDPQRMVQGNDGGAVVSFNGGDTWSSIYNQLTGQFYHIDVDNRLPYRVYGTQQDNSSIAVPSASEKGAIPWADCYPAGTGESGYIAVHPQDPDIVYVGAVGSSPGGGGALQRYDHRTKQIRLVTIWPETYSGWGPKDLKYRFPWTFPILFSPHDPTVIYSTGNHVFKSTDEGSSWQEISPDLTRNDASKLGPSGGPLTLDTSGAEHYCTISTFVESPHEQGILWAGSDDGLIHLSRDGGASWQNVTPPDLPEWSFITVIEPSSHAPGTVYVSATRYKLDDYRPYLFKTEDYGASWQRVDAAFPQDQITRMLREDPARPGLLYVGTERGLFVSPDDGASWSPMPGNLPVVPIYDFKIVGDELAIATHGRAFWILDDLTPIREISTQRAQRAQSPEEKGMLRFEELRLFPPKRTLRRWVSWGVSGGKSAGRNYALAFGGLITYREEKTESGEIVRTLLDCGENPPQGVIVHYALPVALDGEIRLTFLDGEGNEIKSFRPRPKDVDKSTGNDQIKQASAIPGPEDDLYVTTNPGLNRFIWDMRYPEPEKLTEDPITGKATMGVLAKPGVYAVRLTVGEHSLAESFEIFVDPQVAVSEADLQKQFDLWQEIVAKIDATHKAVKQVRRVRGQVEFWSTHLEAKDGDEANRAAVKERAKSLIDALTAVEKELVSVEAKTAFDRLRLPTRLNAKLVGLIGIVAAADAAPPKQAYDVFAHLSAQIDAQLDQLQSILDESVSDFNAAVKDLNADAVAI